METSISSSVFRRLGGLLTLVIMISLLRAQPSTLTVTALTDSLIEQFQRVQDYTVNVKISVKMPRFRMPKKKIRLTFKQPNKIKVEARGFAVVPKTGLALSPKEMLDNFTETNVEGTVLIEGRQYWVVTGRVHPDSLPFHFPTEAEKETAPTLTMTLWVDAKRWVIPWAETRVDTMTVLSVKSTYTEVEPGIWLPEKTELRFTLSGDYLKGIGDHQPMGGPFQEEMGEPLEEGKDYEGVVRLKYSRYRVNQGLSDDIFKDPKSAD
jgi:outer membrane lipoprotein-sorting protein